MTGRAGRVGGLLQAMGTADVQAVLDEIDDDIAWRLPSLGVQARGELRWQSSCGRPRAGSSFPALCKWPSTAPSLWRCTTWRAGSAGPCTRARGRGLEVRA